MTTEPEGTAAAAAVAEAAYADKAAIEAAFEQMLPAYGQAWAACEQTWAAYLASIDPDALHRQRGETLVEASDLINQLLSYAEHRTSCPAYLGPDGTLGGGECDCGLSEILRRA